MHMNAVTALFSFYLRFCHIFCASEATVMVGRVCICWGFHIQHPPQPNTIKRQTFCRCFTMFLIEANLHSASLVYVGW